MKKCCRARALDSIPRRCRPRHHATGSGRVTWLTRRRPPPTPPRRRRHRSRPDTRARCFVPPADVCTGPHGNSAGAWLKSAPRIPLPGGGDGSGPNSLRRGTATPAEAIARWPMNLKGGGARAAPKPTPSRRRRLRSGLGRSITAPPPPSEPVRVDPVPQTDGPTGGDSAIAEPVDTECEGQPVFRQHSKRWPPHSRQTASRCCTLIWLITYIW